MTLIEKNTPKAPHLLILQQISNFLHHSKSSELEALKEIINLLPGHIYWYDKKGFFYGCNDQQAKACGFSKSSELIGKNAYDLQASEAIANILKKTNELVYETGEMQTAEEPAIYYGGKELVYLSKKVPWRNKKSEIIGIIGVSLDITEIKNQERATAIFAQIIDSLPGHVYWKNENGIFMGCNAQQAKSVGLSKSSMLVGKTDYDITSNDYANFIRKIDEKVIKTGQTITQEEPYLFDGKPSIMLSKKTPLKDENSKIIGVLGISFDITEEKQLKNELLKAKSEAESTLKNIINLIPGHVYWKDVNGVYLGCNDTQAKSLGFKSGIEVVGKTDFDLPWKDGAQKLRENDLYVIQHKKSVAFEEDGIFNGKPAVVLSQKIPLEDQNGNVFGVLGLSIDITDRKEKEKLKVETEVQKALLEEQKENQETINKYAHDVRSPVSGAMIILNRCTELPEDKRVPLRKALMRISDMTKNLLRKYNESSDANISKERQPILVSDALLDLLTEKRFEYEKLPIKFEHNFKDYFAFINIEPNAFKRAISNIINNAVDAFDEKEGVVILKLETLKNKVNIIIQDNGKGMPPEIVEKLMDNIEVTHGKENGHGIGFKQVRKTLQDNEGELNINSKIGKGTKITLTFPKINAPEWSVDGIILGTEDILVILDDEDSVKEAWRIHLEPILKNTPNIEMHSFQLGREALNFINNLPLDKKCRVFLLTDFELLNQDLNGLDVVEQSHITRSLLVTSHSTNPEIQQRAIHLGTRILPKALAAEEIPIKIDQDFKYPQQNNKPKKIESSLKQVDIIIVDDDQDFTNSLKNFLFIDKTVDCYHNPHQFLEQVSQYPKDTKICLDNNFAGGQGMRGLELAERLHNMGYNKLYMLSGDAFKKDQIPAYLTAILKTDFESLQKI